MFETTTKVEHKVAAQADSKEESVMLLAVPTCSTAAILRPKK